MQIESQTSKIHELTLISESERDERWEELFLKALAQDFLSVLTEAPQTGPDSWPYLFCSTSPKANEPALKIIEWLSDRGIGLAINPMKEVPDFVLTYGMIWNYRERGQFVTEKKSERKGFDTSLSIDRGQKIKAGDAAPEYFPKYVRSVVKQFLSDQGVFLPKFLILSRDNVEFDICFSLESLGEPPEAEHQGILEALSWFFPTHYTLALISEEGLPDFFHL